MILNHVFRKNIMAIMSLTLGFDDLRRGILFLKDGIKSDFVVYECFELFVIGFSW